MLSIGDIVALAKCGYKPSDVKELIEASKSEPEPETGTPEVDNKPVPSENQNEGAEAENQSSSTSIDNDALVKMTEDLKKQVESLSIQLAEAQSLNKNINNGSNESIKSLDEQLVEMFR